MDDDVFEGGNPMRGEGSPVKPKRGNSSKSPPAKSPKKGGKVKDESMEMRKIMRPATSRQASLEDLEEQLATQARSPAPAPPPRQRSKKPDRELAKEYSKIDTDIELGTATVANSVDSKEMEVEGLSSKPLRENAESTRPPDSPKREESGKANSPKNASGSREKVGRFKGLNALQYALWAHYLAYGSASLCLCMGIFSMLWTHARTYGCHIDGVIISTQFLFNVDGSCPSTYTTPSGDVKEICCSYANKSTLQGWMWIGLAYVIYSFFIVLYENTSWGYGLWAPNDSFWYKNRISPIGILHIMAGGAGCYNYATCLAGSTLIVTGFVYCYSAFRSEAGDGGREAAKKAAQAAKEKKEKENAEKTFSERFWENFWHVLSFNPISFFIRIYNEDKLSSYIWAFIFFIINLIAFVYTVNMWYGIVNAQRNGLLDGTLEVSCHTVLCATNRKAVRYGPISKFAPWAKGFGMLLNLDGALLLLPVIRMLLRKINNAGESFSYTQQHSDAFSRFFAHPMTRYIPLSKNIEFHKLCAITIFFCAWGHMIFHWLNLWVANEVTLRFFRMWRWNGTDYFTGALATFAMFFIYTAAPDVVRMSKYEIFFKSHHMFILFYLALFLHGPVFFYWTAIPVLLYLTERYMQSMRGNRPYLVVKVEWIPPVMAIYFRPVFKEDFPFKEGQYLYLNCPAISPSEWHPFTISSACDDMNNTTRIHLESGEEVMEIPRPKNLPSNAKWNKYCLISQDWQTMDPNDYIDKSETGYYDYITVHVKVHGLEEAYARTWTRKLKEYFELISPGKKFPFYFSRRDARGDIQIGRRYGPDGKTQILRVDGPHAAPAEHYARYGTLMLIGAGIGLTPCVSILTSLTKYRWKKNFMPEILHFYWIIRQNEIDSFQWLIHLLTDLSYELKESRLTNQIEQHYYCEINIYVTAVEKDKRQSLPFFRPKKKFNNLTNDISPTFTADELYEKMLNPTISSKGQIQRMQNNKTSTENHLQDIWIWNGRPNWDEIFKEMRTTRQHSDIGVCFCGAPAIGSDLKTMCEKYSDVSDNCLFSLHKENF